MNQKGFAYIALIIIILTAGVSGLYLYSTQQKNSISIKTEKTNWVDTNEVLLLGSCEKQNTCQLVIADLDGNIKKGSTKNLTQTNGLHFSPNKKHVALIKDNILHIYNSGNKTPLEKKLASNSSYLSHMYDEGFWVSEYPTYKYYNYQGELIRQVSESIFPKHWDKYEDAGFAVKFSPIYENGDLLAESWSKGGGGTISTGWKLSANNRLTKLSNLINYNDETKTDNDPLVQFVTFLPYEPGFLVASTDGLHILKANGDKNPIVIDNLKFDDKTISDLSTSYSGRKFYYETRRNNNAVEKDFSTDGIYEYDLETKQNKKIVSNLVIENPYKYTGHYIANISPSYNYVAISVHEVSHTQSTNYTPAILSLKDYSIKKFDELAGTGSDRVNFYGWIDRDFLNEIIESL